MGVYTTPEQGSFDFLWAIAGKEVITGMCGCYLVPVGAQKTPSKQTQDADLATRFWEWTEQEDEGERPAGDELNNGHRGTGA